MDEKFAMEMAALWRAGKLIGGDEDAVRDALLAGMERTLAALKTIRESGWNEHPTAVWMQKVAAHAMEPNKWPAQPTQPPH